MGMKGLEVEVEGIGMDKMELEGWRLRGWRWRGWRQRNGE